MWILEICKVVPELLTEINELPEGELSNIHAVFLRVTFFSSKPNKSLSRREREKDPEQAINDYYYCCSSGNLRSFWSMIILCQNALVNNLKCSLWSGWYWEHERCRGPFFVFFFFFNSWLLNFWWAWSGSWGFCGKYPAGFGRIVRLKSGIIQDLGVQSYLAVWEERLQNILYFHWSGAAPRLLFFAFQSQTYKVWRYFMPNTSKW